jgi:carboxyl-terminal processing protease
MRKIFLLLPLFFIIKSSAQSFTRQQYKQDFDYFWTTIRDNYAYWDKKQADWDKVKTFYGPMADTVSNREHFVLLLEKVFYELYDHHASLNTNTRESQQLVPSGTDIWAEYINGKPTIIEVKPGSRAARAGMKAGMQLVSVNDSPVEKAIQNFYPKHLRQPDSEAKNFALQELLAGNHADERKITVSLDNRLQVFYPDDRINSIEMAKPLMEIESRMLPGNVGYILINNALGDNQLVELFDSTLTTLSSARAIILDLRNTPSGGNTTVARAILGRFISKEGFYQKHELTSEEKETGIRRSWMEIVSSRKPVYKNPLIILVDHWTGSVSEGIAIGFDALKRATIIGTKMAGLNGANYSFTLPNTGIGFSFPAEKLFHVNGTPRENFRPGVLVDVANQKTGEDPVLQQALKYISKHFR